MAARVCKTCWLNYEIGNLRCAVCGAELEHIFAEVPHEDLDERVTKARDDLKAQVEEAMGETDAEETRTMVWRFTQLRKHGLTFDEAIALARERDDGGAYKVDVHRFADLVGAGATADQAVRILS